MNDLYQTLDHTDLSEETYFLLKEKILKRELKPGHKISINEIAEGLGISRTPVIVSLQRLAGEGLVEVKARRGTYVHGITTAEVEDVFEVRRMIELYAAQKLLEKDLVPQYLAAIQSALNLMEKAASGENYVDYPNFIQGDHDFHLILVGMTGNRHIIDIYRNLNVHMQVSRAHYVADVEGARQTQQEHAWMLECFQSHDLETVQKALDAHIQNVKNRIVQLIQAEGGQI
jgi:GntR family transcriptional regulator, rspAB operon transcriptional repressor